jgi:hypothetical protein
LEQYLALRVGCIRIVNSFFDHSPILPVLFPHVNIL